MLCQEIIRIKREGGQLSSEQIALFVQGLVKETVSEAQAAALAMAICCRGLTLEEGVALTRSMWTSGASLSWPLLHGPLLDKHSTGGVGDTVSLILAPLLASCGAYVPMIAGRGLGHTGGTIDKLEAIPGYNAHPCLLNFQKIVCEIGCGIMGQTDLLAPADKRWYAVRDVTGTVESTDLMTASILSKKCAAGLETLILDVKIGTGAFMTTLEEGRSLAAVLIHTAHHLGLETFALLTDMSTPLSSAAGNAVEVFHAVACLKDPSHDPRLMELTRILAQEALCAGFKTTPSEAEEKIETALTSGAAAECFAKMVAAFGGDSTLVEFPTRCLPQAPYLKDIEAEEEGFVAGVDLRTIGLCLIEMGAGRSSRNRMLDPAVGVTHLARPGQKVAPRGLPLARLHARSPEQAAHAARQIRKAFRIDPDFKEEGVPLILGKFSKILDKLLA